MVNRQWLPGLPGRAAGLLLRAGGASQVPGEPGEGGQCQHRRGVSSVQVYVSATFHHLGVWFLLVCTLEQPGGFNG